MMDLKDVTVSNLDISMVVWMVRPRLRAIGTFVQNGEKKAFWADCFVYQNLDKTGGVVALEVKGVQDFFGMDLSPADKKVFEDAIVAWFLNDLKRTAAKNLSTHEGGDNVGIESFSNL